MSFEWPRHCEGWKEKTVQAMLEDLKLDPDDFDGCAIGVQSATGEPILKTWRIAFSLDAESSRPLEMSGGTHPRPVPRGRDGSVRILPGALVPCDPRWIGRARVHIC